MVVPQKLYMSRFFDIMDIEGLKLSISAGLDVLISLVSAFAKVCFQQWLLD